MTALQFPCTIFETKKKMDDYDAYDMRCGDLSALQLEYFYQLNNISSQVNPYTMTRITPFNQPQSRFYGTREEGEEISPQRCATILFDEFRQLSRLFSLHGPYRHLIGEMITHMQNNDGSPFASEHLNSALKEQILKDRTPDSSRDRLEKFLKTAIDWEKKYYPANKKDELRDIIMDGKIPKFDRFKDCFNGLGITVHDTWATHITIQSLQIDNHRYRAVVHYKVQDHFGLDDDDIAKTRFNAFRFFRIWFVLQRYNKLGFKPFMTNMEATIEITGARNESKK